MSVCGECTQVALYTGSDTGKLHGNIKIFLPVDYDTQLPFLYRRSKINLNITCRSIVTGIPMRALDVMASGGFLLSNKRIIQFIWNFTVIMKIVVLMEKYI